MLIRVKKPGKSKVPRRVVLVREREREPGSGKNGKANKQMVWDTV